jgi:hypothetical protein
LSVRLSAIVTVKLSVEGQQPVEVVPVQRLTDSGAWRLNKALAPATMTLPDGRARWEQSFQLMPLDRGDQPLPLTPLKYRTAKKGWQTASWQPIAVTVTSVIQRVDPGKARDITDIERLPEPTRWSQGLFWPIAALLAAALGFSAWIFVRRWRRSAAALPPDRAALRELDHLLARRLPEAGRGARFSVLAAGIARRYLERRLQLPVQRQTTAEFVAAVQQTSLLPPPQQEMVRDLLERCDLAKFAGVPPTPKECADLAARVRQFVEQTAAFPADKAGRVG